MIKEISKKLKLIIKVNKQSIKAIKFLNICIRKYNMNIK